MLKERSPQQGMTLIEVLISMAVLVLLIALGAPSFFEWTQNQQIRTAAEAAINGLQVARSEAIRRNLPVKVVFSTTDSGWAVTESSSGTAIQSRSGSEGTANAVFTITPSGATTVTFNALGGVTTNADASSAITQLDVSSSSAALATAAARPLRILVAGGGSIRMCDPASTIATTDPRHC